MSKKRIDRYNCAGYVHGTCNHNHIKLVNACRCFKKFQRSLAGQQTDRNIVKTTPDGKLHLMTVDVDKVLTEADIDFMNRVTGNLTLSE